MATTKQKIQSKKNPEGPLLKWSEDSGIRKRRTLF